MKCRNAFRRKRRGMLITQLLARDGDACAICGRPIDRKRQQPDDREDPDAVTIDHVIPVSRGGLTVISNLRLAHFRCNQDRDVAPVAGVVGDSVNPTFPALPLSKQLRRRLPRRLLLVGPGEAACTRCEWRGAQPAFAGHACTRVAVTPPIDPAVALADPDLAAALVDPAKLAESTDPPDSLDPLDSSDEAS